MVLFWLLIVLSLNGLISFGYSLLVANDTTILWGLFTVNFLFFLGVTQAGIVFSTIMQLAKSEWGRHYSRLGEVLTLSFAPVALIWFLVLYFGGTDHLFNWAQGHVSSEVGTDSSPWFGKGLLLWKNVLTMIAFYIVSYIYFFTGMLRERRKTFSYDVEKRMNILAVFVMFTYVLTSSTIAWDYGMTIIPEWESPIFVPFFWVTGVFGSAAVLYLVYIVYSARAARAGGKRLTVKTNVLAGMGKLLLGYTLLWIYMWWSQYFVLLYGKLPHLLEPLLRQMQGSYAAIFWIMIFTLLIIPFLALLNGCVKRSIAGLSAVSILIAVGVWINRYLAIIPIYSDNGIPLSAKWTNCSLIVGGVSITLLCMVIFFRLFPRLSISIGKK